MTPRSRSVFGFIACVSLLWIGRASADGLPDVLGLRPGMPLSSARSVLQAQAPMNRIEENTTTLPTIAKPVVRSLVSAPMAEPARGVEGDWITIDVATPPSEQTVWRVVRRHTFADKGIPKATLLASLRQKYGKETLANPNKGPPKSDSEIESLLWLVDEQGRPAPLPPGNSSAILQSCTDNGELGPRPLDIVEVYATSYKGNNAQQDWCYAHYTAVAAWLSESSPPELYSEMRIEVVSNPMAMRAAEASAKWKKDLAAQQHKQELQKAGQQAAPKL